MISKPDQLFGQVASCSLECGCETPMIILSVCIAVCVFGLLFCYIVLKFVYSKKLETVDLKTTIMASSGYVYTFRYFLFYVIFNSQGHIVTGTIVYWWKEPVYSFET